MIGLVPFEAEHFSRMTVQEAQAWLQENVAPAELKGLEGAYAVTAMQDGVPLVCAGVIPQWGERAFVWSFFSDRVNGRNFPAIHRLAVQFLDSLPFKRLEASVDVDFEPGHRWMRLLGFKIEAPFQEMFQPDGKDSVGYVRIRK